jgi:hypothetical protein
MPAKWAIKYQLKPGRWVFEPTKETKAAGEEIRKAICEKWHPPVTYYHLRSGGHVRALQSHLHHKYFIRADIDDFFGSVNRSRITRCLKGQFGYAQARRMAILSTVPHPAESARWMLPYGFVQSPILASLSLACSRLGTYLAALSKVDGVAVSVYVDDIVVSSNCISSLTECLTKLTGVAEKSGFLLNDAKVQGPAMSIIVFNI